MTSTGVRRFPAVLSSTAMLIAAFITSTAGAQNFGPDPFRPYNSQYDPYTVPMGPAAPEAGPGGLLPRSGVRGANEYQNFLGEMQGAARQGTERYGIGVPYYRSAVDTSLDPDNRREYRPNREVDRSYEKTQERLTQKYLAYFTEKDPRKRAALLRDYTQNRAKLERALSSRRENPSQLLDSIAGSADRPRSSAATTESRLRASGVLEGSPNRSESARRGGSRAIPPPPPIRGEPRRPVAPRRTPTDALNRSRQLDSRDNSRRGGTAVAPADTAPGVARDATTTDRPAAP